MSGWERTYRRRYRKTRFGWSGEIICLYGSWVDRFMEEAPTPTLAARTWRLTERGMRRWCARRLQGTRKPKGWRITGRGDG